MSSQSVVSEIKFNRYQEFFDFISPHREDGLFSKPNHEFIFRGHSNSGYMLVPSAFRENVNLDNYIPPAHEWSKNSQPYIKEFLALITFCKIANQRGLYTPSYQHIEHLIINDEELIKKAFHLKTWISDEYLELMVLAQHYGLPTRLLDWTTNVYIASYFAFRDASDEADITLWCMNKTALEIKKNNHKLKLTMPSYHYNNNLNAQKGVLTYWNDHFEPYLEIRDGHPLGGLSISTINPPIETRPLDELIACTFKDNNVKIDNGFIPFTKISLPGSEAIKGRNVLKLMGFTSSSLFPGYDGVVQEMKFGI